MPADVSTSTVSIRPATRRVDATMLLLVTIWGLNFSVIKLALPVMPPLVFNALRFAGATLLLLAVLRAVEGPWRVKRTDWPGLIGLGIVGHTLYQIFFITGLARTTAGNSSLILSMVPLFVAMLGALFKVERLSTRTWAGIVFAFGGLALLVGGRGDVAFGGPALVGDLLTLLCAVCWASYTVFGRPFLSRYSPLRLTAVTMALGSPAIVVVAVPQLLAQRWAEVTWQAWTALSYASIFAVALGYVIWYASVQAVGGARTAVYSNLIPVVALGSAWLLLHESLNAVQVAGAVVVLVGISVARSGPSAS